jgi:putative ABC transport system substrate-binding protein
MLSAIDPEPYWGLFRDAMQALGYADGKDVAFELRSAQGRAEALDGLAAGLVRSGVDIIVAHQTPAALAARKATSTIPIVTAPAGDPVQSGLVKSLARPGGNVTGMAANTAEVAAAMLELVREVTRPPRATRVGVLANANDAFTKTFLGQLHAASRKMRAVVGVALVRSPTEYDAAFMEWDKLKVHAVVVQPSLPPARAIALAVSYRMPSVAPNRAFAESGGLMSYAGSPREIAAKAAGFADRILRGARPAELPVEQPRLFELTLNLRAARSIELQFPESVMARADALIQ